MNRRIKLVQEKLVERGFPCQANGLMTMETMAAWKAFRLANNVPEQPCPRSLEESPYILLTGLNEPLVD